MQFAKNETLTQIIQYFIVGGLATILDFFTLFVLTEFLELHYLISSVFSFIAGATLNYYLCVLWIFSARPIKNRHYEFLFYLIISGIGLGTSVFFIWAFTELLGLYFMLSKLFATFITFWWNFGARKYFIHTVKHIP